MKCRFMSATVINGLSVRKKNEPVWAYTYIQRTFREKVCLSAARKNNLAEHSSRCKPKPKMFSSVLNATIYFISSIPEPRRTEPVCTAF